MSLTRAPSSQDNLKMKERPTLRKRLLRSLMFLSLVIIVLVAWQLLNNLANSTDPTVAGRPLSNPHTHLHTIALGDRTGVIYLGTHYGLFTSTDGGRTWPQSRGALNTMMITSIAVSPSDPNLLAVIAIPVSGIGTQSGIYFSHDGGNTLQASSPPGLPLSAYPFTVQAGWANAGNFYAFYNYAGWFETRDAGAHWYPITSGAMSNMQTPSFLADPMNPNHLLLGGEQGLFESFDDGHSWQQITIVKGYVLSIAASRMTPRVIFCATDQAVYRWVDTSSNSSSSLQITRLANLPMATLPTRLVTDASGSIVYALSGQDLWYSDDGGMTWIYRWHFDRGDLVSLVVDPRNSKMLYAGFYLPGKVEYSRDGGGEWVTLTE